MSFSGAVARSRSVRAASRAASTAPVSSYNIALDGLDALRTSQTSSTLSDNYDQLYEINREWAEEQALKQMDFQTSANKIAMDFSSAEADKARAWEAEMANTAYQRAVADLKAAGLNPILAYSQGGAAVPSVSAAQGVTSSGAQATMADTGYTASSLDLQKEELAIRVKIARINAAASIAKGLLDI